MATAKILVIDDEDYQRRLMEKLLAKLGYSVTVVDSPEAAFPFLAKEQFPVIITDLIMLEMDGVEFCRLVREENRETVIIALTGHQSLFDAAKLEQFGFDMLLSKPFTVEAIQAAIEKGLELFRERTAASFF
jgi:CheY-like chemotaxis protein